MIIPRKLLAVAAVALPALAFAAGKTTVPGTPVAPPAGGKVVLTCPAGTKQTGGKESALEAVVCVKTGKDGSRVYHGAYQDFWPNGQKQSEGQYEENMRSGHWVFWNQAGVKTGETDFKLGNYDGVKVEFLGNGSKKLEEKWVAGKRQGAAQYWDDAGKVTTIDFKDDRPVTAAK